MFRLPKLHLGPGVTAVLTALVACAPATPSCVAAELGDGESGDIDDDVERAEVSVAGSGDPDEIKTLTTQGRCPVPDPAIDVSYASRRLEDLPLVTEIHAGLTRIDGIGTAQVALELAESFSVSEGGSVFEFRLRPNLKFSDGSPLTASDVN